VTLPKFTCPKCNTGVNYDNDMKKQNPNKFRISHYCGEMLYDKNTDLFVIEKKID